jgi:hypothetical protein
MWFRDIREAWKQVRAEKKSGVVRARWSVNAGWPPRPVSGLTHEEIEGVGELLRETSGPAGKPCVLIDLSTQVRSRMTYAGFEDYRGSRASLLTGTEVEAVEEETGVSYSAVISDTDFQRKLVYLDVDWASGTYGL